MSIAVRAVLGTSHNRAFTSRGARVLDGLRRHPNPSAQPIALPGPAPFQQSAPVAAWVVAPNGGVDDDGDKVHRRIGVAVLGVSPLAVDQGGEGAPSPARNLFCVRLQEDFCSVPIINVMTLQPGNGNRVII